MKRRIICLVLALLLIGGVLPASAEEVADDVSVEKVGENESIAEGEIYLADTITQGIPQNLSVQTDSDGCLTAPANVRWNEQQQTLSWDAVDGAEKYEVVVYTSKEEGRGLAEVAREFAEDNSYQMPAFIVRFNGEGVYYFSVRAIPADPANDTASLWPSEYCPVYDGNGDYISDNRDELPHGDCKLWTLPAPENIKIVYNPERRAYQVSWDEVAGVEDYYLDIQYSETETGDRSYKYHSFYYDGGNEAFVTFYDPGWYYIRVQARSSDQRYYCEYSEPADYHYDAGRLSTLSNMNWDAEQQTLSWDAVDGAEKYEVVVYTSKEEGWGLAEVAREYAKDNSYQMPSYIISANGEGVYYFSVRANPADPAKNAASLWSPEYCPVYDGNGNYISDNRDKLPHGNCKLWTLPAPENIKIVYNPERRAYQVSWDEVAGVEDYYLDIQYSEPETGDRDYDDHYSFYDDGSNEVFVTFYDPGWYYIRVQAQSSDQRYYGEYSETVVYHYDAGRLATPSNVKWDTEQQTLSWDAVDGAEKYEVVVYTSKEEVRRLVKAAREFAEGNSYQMPAYIISANGEGVYYFSVRANPADPAKNAASLWSPEYCPVYDGNGNYISDNRDKLPHGDCKLWTLSAPENVRCFPDPDGNGLRVFWDEVSGADNYDLFVQYSETEDGERYHRGNSIAYMGGMNNSSLIIFGDPGWYFISIRARDYSGRYEGVYSEPIVYHYDVDRLDTPVNLYWDSQEQMLHWDAVPGADQYEINVYKATQKTAELQYVYSDQTESNMYGISLYILQNYGEGTYYFTVRALPKHASEVAPSCWSHEYSYSYTSLGKIFDNRDELPHGDCRLFTLDTPENVQILYDEQQRGYVVTWDAVPNAKWYNLQFSYAKTAEGERLPCAYQINWIRDHSYLIDGSICLYGPGYYFAAVQAMSDTCFEESAWSSPEAISLDANPLAAPYNLKYDAKTQTLSWDWDGPENTKRGFTVEAFFQDADEPSNRWTVWQWAGNQRSFFLDRFTYGEGTYRIRVIACSSDLKKNSSGRSEYITVTSDYQNISELSMPNLRFDANTGTISWDPIPGAAAYMVQLEDDSPRGEPNWWRLRMNKTSVTPQDFLGALDALRDGYQYKIFVWAVSENYNVYRNSKNAYLNFQYHDSYRQQYQRQKLADPAKPVWGVTGDGQKIPGVIAFDSAIPTMGEYFINIYKKSDNTEPICILKYEGWLGAGDTVEIYDFIALLDVEDGEECYYFTVQSVDDYPVDRSEYQPSNVIKSGPWTYKVPEAKLEAPVIETMTSLDLPENFQSMSLDDLPTLEVTWNSLDTALPIGGIAFGWSVIKDGEDPIVLSDEWTRDVFVWNSGLEPEFLKRYGNALYIFSVRYLSTDITAQQHSDWSFAVFDLRTEAEIMAEKMADTAKELGKISENTENVTQQGIREAVQNLDAEVLQAAMLNEGQDSSTDAGSIVAQLAALEEKVGGPAEVEVSEDFNDIAQEQVSVVGANLNNVAENALGIKLILDKPKQEESLKLPEEYQNTVAVKFSMELQGVDNAQELNVPVQITLPVPASINPEYLVILHYPHEVGEPERIHPVVYKENGKWFARIVLTGFSDFAMVVDTWKLENNTLSAQYSFTRTYNQNSILVLALYQNGRMLASASSAVAANSPSGSVSITHDSAADKGVTAKLFWLDEESKPLDNYKEWNGAA